MMNKRPWQIHALLPLAAVAMLAGTIAGHAQQPPQKIDVSKLKYETDNVVIPNPSEVFAALDKMGSPNWSKVMNPVPAKKPSSPPEIAMLLGVVIADGFVAVEAKDREAVNSIGRKVIDLAAALGVREYVIEHSNAITNAAKDDNWSTVRTELDKAKSSVTGAMEKLHSRDQAQLISTTGWLRGTQALTSLIMADYKPERAELLHQPDILATFEKQFETMRVKDNKHVMELREGLKKVKALILASGTEPMPEKSVEEINTVTTELLKTIEH